MGAADMTSRAATAQVRGGELPRKKSRRQAVSLAQVGGAPGCGGSGLSAASPGCHRTRRPEPKPLLLAIDASLFSQRALDTEDAPGIFIELFYKVANVTPTFPRVHAF